MRSEGSIPPVDATMMRVAEATVYDGLARVLDMDSAVGSDLSVRLIGQIAAHMVDAAALAGDEASLTKARTGLVDVREDLARLIAQLDALSASSSGAPLSSGNVADLTCG